MNFVVNGLAAVALLGLAACNSNSNLRPTDTGNMAFPTPKAVGNVGTATPGPDTGSMAQPQGSGGVSVSPQTTPSTGSMALPNRAQGNSLPGRVR